VNAGPAAATQAGFKRMTNDLIGQLGGEALLHVAFLTVAVAFLVRDVLWLRGLSIVAYSMFMAFAGLTQPDAPGRCWRGTAASSRSIWRTPAG